MFRSSSRLKDSLVLNVTTTPFKTVTSASFGSITHLSTATLKIKTTASKQNGNETLILGISIPLGTIALTALVIIAILICKWHRRKRRLQQDLTPYYVYDQAEAEVVDGIIYTSASNSTDMLCVVGDHMGDDVTISPDNDEGLLIKDNYFSKVQRNGSRMDSISV